MTMMMIIIRFKWKELEWTAKCRQNFTPNNCGVVEYKTCPGDGWFQELVGHIRSIPAKNAKL